MTSTGPVHILDQQRTWVAVEKPAGISVHNDPGKDMISRVQSLPEIKDNAPIFPVHRLDKDTSGVLLLARDKTVAAQLSDTFAQHRVKKKYTALVHGQIIDPLPDCGYFQWTWSLTQKAEGRNHPQGKGKRVSCETRFTIVQTSPHYTLLDIRLITGRKHQIRRHAKLAGHPVVCDKRYGSKRSIHFLNNTHGFTRMGLHCRSLELDLPMDDDTIKRTTIQSPNPCKDLIRLIESDRPAAD